MPIPLSLFGEEEVDSPVSAPILDLAGPWGGFLQPVKPWASSAPKQRSESCPPAAPLAAQLSDEQRAAEPHQASSGGSAPVQPLHAESSAARQPELAALTRNAAPESAASAGAESAASWSGSFAEAPQQPASDSALGVSYTIEDASGEFSATAADAAPPAAVSDIPAAWDHSGTHLEEKSDPAAGSTVQTAASTTHAVDAIDTRKSAEDSKVADGALKNSTSPALGGHETGPRHQATPGSIDWDSMDFDFGPVDEFQSTASEPPPTTQAVNAEAAAEAPDRQNAFAAPVALQSVSAAGELRLSSGAEPGGVRGGQLAAESAKDEEWGCGDFEAALSAGLPPESGHDAIAPNNGADWELPEPQAPSEAEPQHEHTSASTLPLPALSDWSEPGTSAGAQRAAQSHHSGFAGAVDTPGTMSPDLAFSDDEWGSWGAPEAAAEGAAIPDAPLPAEILNTEVTPDLAAGPPRVDGQLAPAGSQDSGVLAFDQWGRAYSALEKQTARQPAAASREAEAPAALSTPEPAAQPEQGPWAASSDVWASLAALDEGHAAISSHEATLVSSSNHAVSSAEQSGASADPFAAFDSMVDEGALEYALATPLSTEPALSPLPESAAVNDTASASVTGDPQQARQSAVRVAEVSAGSPLQASSFAEQRSWGDGWADSVADSAAVVRPDQATWAAEPSGSWKQRQEADQALEAALGCDRQTALLCLAQVPFPHSLISLD